ncbi:MAG: hypothetical protein IJP33_02630 [Firmicutes bacterium]|nr:hypothetical protein [Bacillota bacterium]
METLMELLDKVNGIVQDFIDILGPEIFFVAAVFMLLHCFFGYQLLRVWSTIFGMVIGGAIGLLFATNMAFEVPQVITAVIIAAVALGWVFYQIYLVGIFVIFGAVGVIGLHFLNPDASTTFVAVMSCLAGLLGVLCVRPIMIVFSAALGGGLGSFFLLHAQGNFDFDTLVQRTIIFAACGVLCQFILTTPFRRKTDDEEAVDEQKEKHSHVRPLMERIFVKPIEQVQPEEIDHEEGLPSAEDLDKMIAEQMTGMTDDANDFAADIDFSVFEKFSDAAFEEADADISETAEEKFDEVLDENGLPDIPDTVLDEMIIEALPEAEEYLPSRETAACEDEEILTESAETLFFDENALNDFAITEDAEYVSDIGTEIEEMTSRLEKGELRTAEEIEERIVALEEVIEKDVDDAKGSIFSNPFRAEKTGDAELPMFSAGMSLAEAAAALQVFANEETDADSAVAVAAENDLEECQAEAEMEKDDAEINKTEFLQTDILFAEALASEETQQADNLAVPNEDEESLAEIAEEAE